MLKVIVIAIIAVVAIICAAIGVVAYTNYNAISEGAVKVTVVGRMGFYSWPGSGFELSSITYTYRSETINDIWGGLWPFLIFSSRDTYVVCELYNQADDKFYSSSVSTGKIATDNPIGEWKDFTVNINHVIPSSSPYLLTVKIYEKGESGQADQLKHQHAIGNVMILAGG